MQALVQTVAQALVQALMQAPVRALVEALVQVPVQVLVQVCVGACAGHDVRGKLPASPSVFRGRDIMPGHVQPCAARIRKWLWRAEATAA